MGDVEPISVTFVPDPDYVPYIGPVWTPAPVPIDGLSPEVIETVSEELDP